MDGELGVAGQICEEKGHRDGISQKHGDKNEVKKEGEDDDDGG